MLKDASDVFIYAIGLCCMSVCVPKGTSIEDMEKEVNQRNKASENLNWKLSKDKTFKGGKPNPCPCDKKPNDRVHYLLNC